MYSCPHLLQTSPCLLSGGGCSTCTLWAKTREGEASETGSMHPPTPARTPCHLPPMSPNSSLGQGLAPASRAPGWALGPTLHRCACQASPVASQGPSWAGPRQVPQCCSQPDCSVQGQVLSRAHHPCTTLASPTASLALLCWPCPLQHSLSSFSSPPAALLLRLSSSSPHPFPTSPTPGCCQLEVWGEGT